MKKSLLVCVLSVLSAVSYGVDGVRTFRFPVYRITAIQDVANRMPAGLFSDTSKIPTFQPQEKDYAASVNVFLVEKKEKRYLIDAGFPAGKGTLHKKLEQMNLPPSQIDAVLITHIHPDHVGGLTVKSPDGKEVPFFPRADLYIAKTEYDAWIADPNRAALKRHLEPYGSRLRLFEYEKELPGGFVPLKMEGHTPGHTVFVLGDSWLIGDIFHAVDLQVPHPTFCAKYDMDPERAVHSRYKTLMFGKKLFGAHVPFPGGMSIVRHTLADGRYSFSYKFIEQP